ncbi:hypothetical protein DRE_06973 [Drechslerella stenobrocha 248]|uniref:Uncharacterized protein n=1 Tax=Drechslerella stenobrocha 248 TaxID=1043628 RepID=W7HW70_9PEZI|nr:hypothetical protein DRE_06973 [Drechslerella stenobrocha 248]
MSSASNRRRSRAPSPETHPSLPPHRANLPRPSTTAPAHPSSYSHPYPPCSPPSHLPASAPLIPGLVPSNGSGNQRSKLPSTHPQPHFHRGWYQVCHHLQATVRVPVSRYSLDGEVGPNDDKLCMCDSPDGYYYEEVDVGIDQDGSGTANPPFVERGAVEAFWRFAREEAAGRSIVNGDGGIGKGLGRAVIGKVADVLSPDGRKKRQKRDSISKGGVGAVKVKRWVPRWRREEGLCALCKAAKRGEDRAARAERVEREVRRYWRGEADKVAEEEMAERDFERCAGSVKRRARRPPVMLVESEQQQEEEEGYTDYTAYYDEV